MRIDTLARILTLGNVHSGVNALVVETCQGLLMGAVLERLGGTGIVTYVLELGIHVYCGFLDVLVFVVTVT